MRGRTSAAHSSGDDACEATVGAAGVATESAAPTVSNWIVQWDWLSVRHDSFQKEVEPAIPTAVPLGQLPNKGRRGVVAFADGHVDFIGRGMAHSPEHVLPQY